MRQISSIVRTVMTPSIIRCRSLDLANSASSHTAQQASSLAYFDVFSFSAAVGLMLVFFILLMRRSLAEKGARIGGE